MKSCIVLLFCCAAFGQQFEVASVKPAAPMPLGQMRIGMNADGAMVRYTNVSLKDCIRTAYRVKDFQIQGPDWLSNARFDITAKLPEGATQEQVPEMLQALLAERFKLQLHRESKEHAVYALVVGKDGAKLKPAETEAPAQAADKDKAAGLVEKRTMVAGGGGGMVGGQVPRNAMMMAMGTNGAHLMAPSATLAGVADMLSRFAERPVVDQTGIQGRYNFDFTFTPETTQGIMPRMTMPPAGGAERPPADIPAERAGTIFEAVEQYGLKLEPRKAPLEFLIIDHVEKTPTEN
jgi:uncharacterized protein (TIGR03435 family)